MPLAGRVGDNAKHDGGEEPAQQGSPDVLINGHAAMRVGDPGKHWTAKKGSKGVLINGIPAHRVGDETKHDTGSGQLVDGSQDVFIGDLGGGEAKPVPHNRSLAVQVTDALQRGIHDVMVRVSCPHEDDKQHQVTGGTTLSGLCSAATVMIQKALQKGTWDKGAASPAIIGPSHAHVDAPHAAAAAPAPAPDKKPPPEKPAPAPQAAAPAAKPAAAPPASAPAAKPEAAAPAVEQSHIVHAPAPAATPPEQHEVQIVRPTTATAHVQLTTVHNWVETVFRAFGQTMPTGATEIAILGVREASLSGKGTEDQLEAEAAAGETDKETTTRETRDADFAHDPGWNDLLFIAYTDSTPEKAQHVDVFECTIDAGVVESSLGIPITLEGKLYGGHPGDHLPNKYPGNNICLHIYYESYSQMALARECTKRYRTFTNLASAKNPETAWRFAGIEPDPGIHMHFGLEVGPVSNWSAGCTVLHHHYWTKNASGARVPDPKATRYKHFMDLYNGAANKAKIPYLVVSSQYVRSYAEWARLLDQQPGEATKNESVILKDKLKPAPGMAGRYLASFVTADFARDVVALAAQADTTKAHAANLKSSMELVTFALSI